MSTDQSIEQEIQAKGLTAPRVTPADIEAAIASEHYFTAMDGLHGPNAWSRESPAPRVLDLLTFCVLVLRNGFTVTGQSACASPENFDDEVGRKIARQDAIRQVWPLLGYELRSKLASEKPVFKPYTSLGRGVVIYSERDVLSDDLRYRVSMPDGAVFEGRVQPLPGMSDQAVKGMVLDSINRQAEARWKEANA